MRAIIEFPKRGVVLATSKGKAGSDLPRYESTKLEGIYPVLDGVAWLDTPTTNELAQFSGLDSRTVGKLLKNAQHIGLIDKQGSGYALRVSYPYKGLQTEKSLVMKEALLKLPLLTHMRQFLALGDNEAVAIRKAATLCKYVPFDAQAYTALLSWARSLDALQTSQLAEDMVDDAEAAKESRHMKDSKKIVAFLSHSSQDKPFIRQLAADLATAGISVWLDEQRIHVGDSIPDKINQGLASSDYFLIAISESSVASEWVKKELNSALVNEVT